MNDEQILKLIRSNEESIIGLMIVNGLVEPIVEQDGYKFDNIKPTSLGRSILGETILFDDAWLKQLRAKWPLTLRGSSSELRDKCEKFITKNKASLEEVENIVTEWLRAREAPYCGKMTNFFYKTDAEGRIVSEAENMYEGIRESSDDYRFSQA